MKTQQELLEAFQVAMSVLEAVRATTPVLIADNMPADWGMNRLRSVLANAATPGAVKAVEPKTAPKSASLGM